MKDLPRGVKAWCGRLLVMLLTSIGMNSNSGGIDVGCAAKKRMSMWLGRYVAVSGAIVNLSYRERYIRLTKNLFFLPYFLLRGWAGGHLELWDNVTAGEWNTVRKESNIYVQNGYTGIGSWSDTKIEKIISCEPVMHIVTASVHETPFYTTLLPFARR